MFAKEQTSWDFKPVLPFQRAIWQYECLYQLAQQFCFQDFTQNKQEEMGIKMFTIALFRTNNLETAKYLTIEDLLNKLGYISTRSTIQPRKIYFKRLYDKSIFTVQLINENSRL